MALNTLRVRKLTKAGHYGDGGGLYLKVAEGGGRSWQFRYRPRGTGKTVWLGLGAERDVTLAEARQKAAQCRKLLAEGKDPLGERKAAKAAQKAENEALTFEEVAERYIASHESSWRNQKHRQQWRNTLRDYVFPVVGAMPVAAVSVGEVMEIIEPIWEEKPETASRVRGRIEAVLDYATAREWRPDSDNPARWKGRLANLLPARNKVRDVEHQAALDWREIGQFMAALRKQKGMSALAAEFCILTATRSGETRGARWNEIDTAAKTWTVAPERMKAHREHRVPLSSRALEILHTVEPLREAADGLVFTGGRRGKPLSDVALSHVVKAIRDGITVHGFRSTFRDWCAEATNYPREVAETALAHANKDKTEAAYFRADLFAKRARLMREWASFCDRIEAAKVVPIRMKG